MIRNKFKDFIRSACKGITVILMLSAIMISLTGCGQVDNSMVNKAFANSAVMNSISSELQGQATLIAEMQRMGVIPDTMANNLNEQLNRIYKAASTLTNGATTTSTTTTSTDPSTTPPPITIGAEYNDFIGSVLRSLTMLGDNLPTIPPVATELSQTGIAESFVQAHGSPIDGYSGYNTKKIIETTGYAGIATYSVAKAKPLAPFGDMGNDTISALVDHINKLKDIQVYYVDANKVGDTKSLQGLKTAIDEAKADISKTNILDSDYFINSGETINFTDGSLNVGRAYSVKEVTVNESNREVARYKILLLNRDALLDAFNKTSSAGDLSSGVLIGNKFFITRYPVAVFRGFEQTADKTKYIPVFTHPQFLSGSTYGTLSGSIFSGSASAYTDTLKTGDKGTAETKCAYIDLYSGAMYYKDEQIGNANTFMSIGTADLESSVVIKPNTAVYVDNNNQACITTVAQTTKFNPSETLHIGDKSSNKVTLPGNDTNIMPVVFLMDYLELAYSPNTVGTDAFTAYGRKVRLDEKYILGSSALSASTGTIAYVVGEGATQSEWTSKVGYSALTMTDFLDIDGIYNSDLSIKSKDSSTDSYNVSAAVHFISAGTSSFEKAGTVRSGDPSSERSDTLPQISAGSGVECIMMFGANGLNSTDSNNIPKTPLYGITLYGGLYERALFSDWINASGNANLVKWAKTVSDLGYKNYAISNAVLTEKMKGNYAFELNEDGLLTIDLNTVVQINDDLKEERRGGGVVLLRTALLILGFILVSYVSVLLAAWSLDVNLDLGLNILEKVSFGHFVAVRSLDEMPDADPDSTTTYVDFRRLIMRCLAFAAVGVILITIDPVNLIVKLLGWLNFLLNIISEKLFGVKIM
ncbi:MAG: hypothetical protein K0S76_158 [Herbinix sp.]|jgi:hypothetical protein|nr:hypothetical protein [Herbinix sp.]